MLETVRIRRAGFPVRLPYDDFLFRSLPLLLPLSLPPPLPLPRPLWVIWFLFVVVDYARYKVLLRGKAISGDPRADCVLLLKEYDPSEQLYKLGNTKVGKCVNMSDI